MKMGNKWIESYGRRVSDICFRMEKLYASNAVPELNLREVVALFNGAKFEIERLQKQIDELESKEKKDVKPEKKESKGTGPEENKS